jgi:hypothetical protein
VGSDRQANGNRCQLELKANPVGDIMDSSNITSNKTDGTADRESLFEAQLQQSAVNQSVDILLSQKWAVADGKAIISA